MTNPDWNATNWNAMDVLVDVHKNISQAPVFNLYVSGDIKNSNENVLVVSHTSVLVFNVFFEEMSLAFKMQCYIVKNTLFHFAFFSILHVEIWVIKIIGFVPPKQSIHKTSDATAFSSFMMRWNHNSWFIIFHFFFSLINLE